MRKTFVSTAVPGGLEISTISDLSRQVNIMILPITQERFLAWARGRTLVQEAFPELTKEQREFLLTGSTQAEWDAAFPPEEDA